MTPPHFYIVECVTPGVTQSPAADPSRTRFRAKYTREMVGPFMDYEEAHEWVELHIKSYPLMQIHKLTDQNNTPLPHTPGVSS